MLTIGEMSTNVPAFLGKLWKMVEDPETDDLITWNSSGTTFLIKDEIRFARELLPMYYKHNNMASFIRQLNMYGFHKIVSTDAGCMKTEVPDEIQFEHPFFIKDHPYLLENIKRKINTGKVVGGEKTPQVITKVLSDMTQMKGRQDNMDGRLMAMKLENEALWRELSLLRQKHIKQQQIVNKLIQFLVTIVQQNQNSFSVKRKFHRMLQHEDDRLSSDYKGEEQTHSPEGPVIHELDPAEALLETVVEEAAADTPTGDTTPEFFLSQSLDDEGVVEMPHSNEPLDSEETIPDIVTNETIGIPELKFEPKMSSSSNSNTQNVRTIYIPKRQQKETVLLKPPFMKFIPKNNENHLPKLKLVIQPDKGPENKTTNQSPIYYQQPDILEARIQDSRKPIEVRLRTDKSSNNQTAISRQQDRLRAPQRIKVLRKQHEVKPKINESDNQSSVSIQHDRLGVPQRVQITRRPQEIKQDISSNRNTNNQPSVVFYKPTTNTEQRQRNQQIAEALQSHLPSKKVKFQNNKQPQMIQVSRNNLQVIKNQRNVQQANSNRQPTQTINLKQSSVSNKPVLLQRVQSPRVEPSVVITIPSENNKEHVIGLPPVESDELQPLLQPMESTSTNYSMPVIIDVRPQTEPSPAQQPMVSPQDLLLGSPPVINDQVMTPAETPPAPPPSTASTTSVPEADMQVACMDESSPNYVTRSGPLLSEMDSHVDNMQADLDNLKELLRSEGISLDANALLGYFNEDPFAYNISDPIPPEDPNKPKETSGNELMTFANNPSFYDLADLIGNDMNDWSLPSPGCSEPLQDDSFAEVNTPQFVPQSPSFTPPSKKRKK